MSTVYANGTEFNYCCGVSEIGGFNFSGYWNDDNMTRAVTNNTQQQTGMFVSTFTNTTVCKLAYEQLCKENTLLYQSPTKRNRNSGHQVFLCVFLAKGR